MIYEVKIGIDSQSEEKAIEIATDLVDIRNALSDKDLKELKNLLKYNPGIIKIAKKFLGKE